jgi:SAM-dependent methyltransferase
MREADIRPADVHAEYLRLSAADAARLFADAASCAERPCPGCGEERPRPAFAKHGFDLARCAACDTLYVTPCPKPERLAALYADSPSARYWAEVFFPAVAEARRTRIFRPRALRALAVAGDIGVSVRTLTDVGAGAAIFLEETRAARPALALRAVEPGAQLARQCRAKGFDTYEGYAEEAALKDGWRASADLVTSFEVIEHTPDSLGFVRALAALARPGGAVLVSGLTGDGFDIRTLGARANAIAPPHHLTFLSCRGAEALMRRAGLTDVHVSTPGELDVDIVRNALKADNRAVTEPFLRELLLDADDATRAAFQSFLAANRLSSHMWMLARRPE